MTAYFVEVRDPIATIPTQESKATVAGWSFLNRYIVMGHENGAVSQWDWKVILRYFSDINLIDWRDD